MGHRHGRDGDLAEIGIRATTDDIASSVIGAGGIEGVIDRIELGNKIDIAGDR